MVPKYKRYMNRDLPIWCQSRRIKKSFWPLLRKERKFFGKFIYLL